MAPAANQAAVAPREGSCPCATRHFSPRRARRVPLRCPQQLQPMPPGMRHVAVQSVSCTGAASHHGYHWHDLGRGLASHPAGTSRSAQIMLPTSFTTSKEREQQSQHSPQGSRRSQQSLQRRTAQIKSVGRARIQADQACAAAPLFQAAATHCHQLGQALSLSAASKASSSNFSQHTLA